MDRDDDQVFEAASEMFHTFQILKEHGANLSWRDGKWVVWMEPEGYSIPLEIQCEGVTPNAAATGLHGMLKLLKEADNG